MRKMISQTRGDTRKYKFQRKNADGSVILNVPNKMFFTVKQDFTDDKVLIQKRLPDDFEIDEEGFWHFTIEPEDTNDLNYGDYVFDVEVITDGVKSTIAKGGFVIEPEVTFADDED